MGGKPRKGYCVIGGLVKKSTREFYDELVRQKMFNSRSEAIGHVLNKYVKGYGQDARNGDK